MNEIFAAVNMVDLVAGIIIIAVGLVAVYVIFVGKRFAMKALDDVYGSGGGYSENSGSVLTDERWTIMENEHTESAFEKDSYPVFHNDDTVSWERYGEARDSD